MSQIDQFESVFKAAAKPVFEVASVSVRTLLVVTDLDSRSAQAFAERLRSFLRVLEAGDDVAAAVDWQVIDGSQFGSVGDLLALVEQHAPDLICTYRNLHSNAWQWPYTLGDHLEVLTQTVAVPVLVVPRPDADGFQRATEGTGRVMAITDHLAGEQRLVNWAIRFTAPQGCLYLTHVEDHRAFDRYIDVISKLPGIDTDMARAAISKRLLKEPRDYIRSTREALQHRGSTMRVEEIVTLGRHLEQYRHLVSHHAIDLLVFSTKDQDQLAMHGLAYPLAVELRGTALLML